MVRGSGGADTWVLPVLGVSAMTEQQMVRADARVMRALAHPARLAIMDYLGRGATATATDCAEIVGLSPSATSYHLRALERFGLVEEAPTRGDGRERVWRSRIGGLELDMPNADADEMQAARELAIIMIERQDAQFRHALTRMAEDPEPWRDTVLFNDVTLLVTAEEMVTIGEAISELLLPYTRRSRSDSPPPGAFVAKMVVRGFPDE